MTYSINDLINIARNTVITDSDIEKLNVRLSEFMTCKGHISNNAISTLYIHQCQSCRKFNPKDGEDTPLPLKNGWCLQYVNV